MDISMDIHIHGNPAESRVIEPDLPSKFTFAKNPTYAAAAAILK